MTDIRGGGALAVEQLLYFMENRAEVAVAMAEQHEPEATGEAINDNYFPFATAAVHVSRMTLELFGVVEMGIDREFRNVQTSYYHFAATEEG